MAGGGGTTVNYPAPSKTEQELLQEQLELLRLQRSETEAFKPILLSQFGLEPTYSYGAASPDDVAAFNAKNTQLQQAIDQARATGNPEAIVAAQEAWRQHVANPPRGEQTLTGYQQTEEKKAQEKAYQDLVARQNEITLLQLDRQKKALAGELPLSEGSAQRKVDEFRIFKEQSARAGNPIFGDSLEEAFSTTTAGNEALKSFRSSWKLAEDAERRGELSTGAQLLNSSIGLSSGLRDTSGNTASTIPDLGTSRLLPGYISALQPYQFQRQGQFNAGSINAQTAAQREAGLMNLFGVGLGSAAGLYALSSEEYKDDIKETKDEKSLKSLRGTKVYNFKYKHDPDTEHVGLIAERSPRELVSKDGKMVSVMDTVSMVASAVRALDKKIEKMNGKKREAVYG